MALVPDRESFYEDPIQRETPGPPSARLLPPLFQIGPQEEEQPQGSLTGDLALSWEIGWKQMTGVRGWLKGVGASLLEKAGFEDAARNQKLETYNLLMEMQDDIYELDALYKGPNSWAEAQEQGTIGSYALWGINEAIKQVPNLATMALTSVATAGVGGFAFAGAKAGIRLRVARMLSRMPGTRQTFARGRTWDAADPEQALNLMTGRGSATLGVVMGSAVLNTGEIYSSVLLETGEDNPAVTGLAGLVAGSLDMWPAGKVIRMMGKSRDYGGRLANAMMSDKKWRGRLYGALERTVNAAELGATEALVEDLQTVIEAFTVNYLNDNNLAREFVDTAYGIVPLTADQVAGRMEARAAGALFGVLGFFGRGTGGRRPRKSRYTITEEDVREIDEAIASTGDWDDYSLDEQDTIAATFEGIEGPGFTLGTRPLTPEGRDAPIRDLTRGGLPITARMGDVTRFSREEGTPRRPGFGSIPDDATTRQAAEALDGTTTADGKPKSARRIKTEQERAAALAQQNRELAELQAEVRADLERDPLEGGRPVAGIPASGVDVGDGVAVPTVSAPAAQRAEAEFIEAVVDTTAPDPRSLEVQQDLESALTMVMQEIRDKRIAAGDTLSREDAAEAEKYKNLQLEVAIEEYYNRFEKARKAGLKEGELLALNEEAKEKGTRAAVKEVLEAAGFTPADIGITGNPAKEVWYDALETFLASVVEDLSGRKLISRDYGFLGAVETSLSQEEAVEYNTALKEAREENALRKADALIELIEAGGGTNPVYGALLEKWGTLDLQSMVLRSRIQDEIRKRREGRESTLALARQKAEAKGREARRTVARVFKTPEERAEVLKKRKLARAAQPTLTVKKDKLRARGRLDERRRPLARATVPKDSLLRAAEILRKDGKTKEADRLVALAEAAPEEAVVTTTERIADLVASVEETPLIPAREEAADVLSPEEWLNTEAAFELIRETFTLGDKGNNTPRGQAAKLTKTKEFFDWIKTYLPDGKDAYDPKFYTESDLGQIELKLKQEIAKRRVAKAKGIFNERNWEEKVSQAEIDKEVENIKFVSPAGTYVMEQKPPRAPMLFYKRENGEVVLDEEGNPEIEVRVPETHEVLQLPERYIGYDQHDQLIAQQFVDDERNFEIRAKLNMLLARAKKKGGTKDDIPMEKLAEVLKEYGIRSSFVGVVRSTRGRAKEVYADVITMEGWVPTEERNIEGWYKAETENLADELVVLGEIADLYFKYVKKFGESKDAKSIAWNTAYNEITERIKDNTKALRAQLEPLIMDEFPEISDKELTKKLKAENAIFSVRLGAIEKIVKGEYKVGETTVTGREWLTDPANIGKSIPFATPATPGQVYDSIRNSASRGERALQAVGYSETRDNFLSRFSTSPREPRAITPGAKVQLLPAAWASVFTKKGSRVSLLSADIQKTERKIARTFPKSIATQETLPKESVGYKREAEFQQDLNDTLQEQKQTLQTAMDEIMNQPFNVVRKFTVEGRVNLVLEPISGGKRVTAKLDNVALVEYSRVGLDKLQAAQVYAVERDKLIQDMFHKRSPNRIARESESRGQKIRRVIKEVDQAIEKEASERAEKDVSTLKAELERRLEEAKSDAEKKEIKADVNKRIRKIRDDARKGLEREIVPGLERLTRPLIEDDTRYYRIMEALSKETHLGGYLLRLPKDLEEQVALGKIERVGEDPGISAARRRQRGGASAIEQYLDRIKKQLAKEGKIRRRARFKKEWIEDNDLDLIDSLLTPEGTWLPEEQAKATWTIPDVKGKSLLDKLQVKPEGADVYAWLKARYSELMFAIEDRLPLADRRPRFEGGQMPPIWDTQPWVFVQSSEMISKAAYETMLRETQKEHQIAIKGKRVFETGDEAPTKRSFADYLKRVSVDPLAVYNITGEFLNAAPVNRWKNAYGIMIDEVSFEYKSSDGVVEIRTVFEVVDPYKPENFQTFNTREEALKVFESEKYYKKLGNRRGRQLAPSPAELGRKPTFARPADSHIRPGTPDRIWMPDPKEDRPAATQDILNENDAVIQGTVLVQQIEPQEGPDKPKSKSKIAVTDKKIKTITYPALQEKRLEDARKREEAARDKQEKRGETLQNRILETKRELAMLSSPVGVGRTKETAEEAKKRLREVVEKQIEAKDIDKDLWSGIAKSNSLGVTRIWNIVDLPADEMRAIRKRSEAHEAKKTVRGQLVGRLPLKEVREYEAKVSYIAQRVDQLYEEELAKPKRKLARRLTKKQKERVAYLNKRIKRLENEARKEGIDVERIVGARFSLVLESEYSDDGTLHFLFAEKGEKGSSRSDVVDALGEAFGRQVFQFMRVVQTEAELPIDIRLNRIGYEAPIRGVSYNNQIWLVADNLPVDRAVAVGLHEIGAHGFQAVMGPRFYQKLMKQVAVLVNTDEEFGAIYNRLKTEMPTANEPLLLEETFAYAVENQAMKDTPFWRGVVDAILYALAKLKLWVNPKKVGAKEILIFAKAAARKHAMLAESGDARYAANFLNTFLYSGRFEHSSSEGTHESNLASGLREDLEYAHDTGFHDDWLDRDVPEAMHWWERFVVLRDVSKRPRASDLERPIKENIPSQIRRTRKLFGREYQLYVAPDIVKWIQNYTQILGLMEKSVDARGGNIDRSVAPSVWYGRYKNRVEHLRGLFERDYVFKLRDFVYRTKVSGDDLYWWAYAKHAPSRNEVKKGKAKSQGLPNASGLFTNKADRDAWFAALPEGAKVYPHNYKYAEGEGGVIDEIEKRLGRGSEALNNLQKAYDMLRKVNQLNLSLQLESGLLNFDVLSPEQRKAYAHPGYRETYIPLMGQDTVIADEFFEKPLGPSKMGVAGTESKAARGRQDLPENIWAHSMMNVYHTIDRIEKNKVIKSFAELILANRENFKDFATVVKLKDYEKHVNPATGRNWLGMHEKQQTHPDHNIHFKQNGQEWVILVTDKRIGQAYNRTNMTDSGAFLQLTSQLNRYYSAIHTSMYPEFIVGNFVRDLGTALGHLEGLKETMEDLQDQKRVTRNILKNIKGAGVGLKQNIRDGRRDTYWSNRAHQFGEAGGRINFFGFKNVRDFEKKWNSFVSDTSVGAFKRHFKMVTEFVSDYNAVVENVIRLSTFDEVVKILIANGRTEVDAHMIAGDVVRNLTVNFSQKGEMSSGLNALYLFFNASVQGSARMFQALFARPGKYGKRFTRVQKLAGSIMLMGFAQSILNSVLGGDDEDGRNRYAQIDLTNRSRQGYFYIPGFDTFMKVPWAYGYNFFWAVGDTAGALMMGQANPGQATMHLASTAAESFMPFSFGAGDNLFKNTLSAVSPTFIDPLVDLAINESYFGQPIYKENLWGSSDPPSERYWGSTGPIFKGISRGMNALTGGSRAEEGFFSISPDILEFVWETASGGIGRFAENTTDLVWNIGPGAMTHKDTGMIKWNKISFLRRFVHDEGATNARNVYDEYIYYERAVNAAVGLEAGIKEIYGPGEQYDNFKESPDYKLYQQRNKRKRAVSKITKLQEKRNKARMHSLWSATKIQEEIDRLEAEMRKERLWFINEMVPLFGK